MYLFQNKFNNFIINLVCYYTCVSPKLDSTIRWTQYKNNNLPPNKIYKSIGTWFYEAQDNSQPLRQYNFYCSLWRVLPIEKLMVFFRSIPANTWHRTIAIYTLKIERFYDSRRLNDRIIILCAYSSIMIWNIRFLYWIY